MRLISVYIAQPVASVAILFGWIGVWAEFLMLDMLDNLFRSAVGKRRGQYLSSCTWPRRFFRTYIPQISGYRRGISCYLVVNRIVAWLGVVGMLLLMEIEWLVPAFPKGLIHGYAAVVIVLVFLPPIILSFVLTRYRGGHPRYVFDLSADFIGQDGVNAKRELLREKKDKLLLTPEQFAAMNEKRRRAKK